MSRHTNQPIQSTSDIATSWLDGQLSTVLAKVCQRLRQHVFLISGGTAVVLGFVAFFISAMGRGISAWHDAAGAFNAAALAIAASVMTAAVLYPVLRRGERWLHQAVSTITHDTIDVLSVLGKVTELRNGETAGHNLRVTLCTLLFVEALELTPEEIVRTVKGALLHDVGKLAVPDAILGKPGRLTADERVEMTKHVSYGLEIVSQSQVLLDAAPVVGGHHEKYDGSGYPLGLKAEDIPREARLFALVDVFDALMSARVYKPAYSIEEALATMAEGRGSHFDPVLFDRFVELAPDFAARLPPDEPALAAMLMEQLRPYFELIAFGRVMPASPDIDQVSTATQVFRKTAAPAPPRQ